MALKSEEARVIEAEQNSTQVISAFNRIPYGLINAEVEGSVKDTLTELTKICQYYKVYEQGAKFTVEGSNGDYVPSNLNYKMSASLIDKEARFLFAEAPDIVIDPKGDAGSVTEEAKKSITTLQDLVKTILDKNNFEEQLIKAARDCFIGKRVACLVNFNEDDGVTITFLPSTQFLYEYKMGSKKLGKFVAFIIVKDSLTLSEKRIFKKKYEVEKGPDGSDIVYLEEALYDGAGMLIEEVTKRQEIQLDTIPVVVILNDGLTGDNDGESEIQILEDYESWYSKLSNADIDSERKTMNPIKYTVDMDSNSTKGLSTAAGAYWDLGSDQNLDHPNPQVGTIESSMSYSQALKNTLDRIKTTGYEQVDMPNITLETMTGAVTSGKALKAVYWPLIVRCKEKMKTWGPQLSTMVEIIIEGAKQYPNCIKQYTDDAIIPVAYEVHVDQNTPLPEDEIEEKNMNLSEVESRIISRKTYLKKWFEFTDDEVSSELEQIALETNIIDNAAMVDPFEGQFADGGEGMEEEGLDEEPEVDEDDQEAEDLEQGNEALQGVLDQLDDVMSMLGMEV